MAGPTTKRPRKPYWEMTTAELAEATKEFDSEWPGPGLPGKPLTSSQRAMLRRAAARGAAQKKKVGRPAVGKGAKLVPVTIERGLLKQADAFAKRHGLKRSQMVAQGLRLVMEQGQQHKASA